MDIRAFRIGDEAALHKVFLSAIHHLACKDYTPEQIEAWAPASLDPGVWIDRMRGIAPFVVQCEGSIVAYADLQSDGYMDHFFVSAPVARAGVGTLLMDHIHAVALVRSIATLTSDVSRTAQPFFAKFGFAVVEQRTPVVRGVVVPNALMRKQIEGVAKGKLATTVELAAKKHRASVQVMLDEYLLELGSPVDYPYLDLYWEENGRFPYIIRVDAAVVGFAFVRKNERDRFEMAEFCIFAAFRRIGAGSAAAAALFSAHPGEWELQGFPGNAAAAAFWEHAITECSRNVLRSTEDGRPVFRFSVSDTR